MASERTIDIWLRDAGRGDVLALQKLVMIHHGRLRAIAARKLTGAMQTRIDADDLLQDVYADAVQRVAEFEPRGPDAFFRWLLRILDSKLIDARRFHQAGVRDVKREAAPASNLSWHERIAARVAIDSQTPSRIISRREREALLAAALAGLSEDYRRVLELRYAKEYPLIEVAGIMQRTPAAVQMLCARALRSLRDHLRTLSRVSD